MLATRKGCWVFSISPRRPLPSGRGPIRARSSAVMPVVVNRVLLSLEGPQGRLEVVLAPGTNGHSGQPVYEVRLKGLRMTAVSLAEAYAVAAELMAQREETPNPKDGPGTSERGRPPEG